VYNNTYIAGGFFRTGYKMTDEQRKNLSDIRKGMRHTEETKKILREHSLGYKHRKETLEKLSIISKNSWRKKEYRDAFIEKRKELWAKGTMRETMRKKCKKVSFINQETGIRETCDNVFIASEKTGYSVATVRAKLQGLSTNKNFYFRYE